MIEIVRGDILHTDVEAVVNTVNCVGVMGRGIALQFRKAYPENFKIYEAACERKQLQPGKMLVFATNRLDNPKFIINFPTKRHWKGKSKIEDIEAGLDALVTELRALGVKSVAIPPLGCGLGGLKWSDVRPRIERALVKLPDLRTLLFEPSGAPPAEEMVHTVEAPKLTAGRAALLGLIRRYLAAVMDPFVTLLEVHKLMYFMQEAGEPLRLHYEKGTYGPYAKNLRHVLTAIEGHFITGYGDAEDDPDKQIELQPGASDSAERFLADHDDTLRRFDRVGRLISGFETSFGMELLATVHWVGAQECASSVADAVARTYAWNERKRMFTEDQIEMAWGVLQSNGWLPPSATVANF